MKIVALIPAKSVSQRLSGKNIKQFNGHPLLAYAIRSAIDANIFTDVFCTSDSQEYLDIAYKYDADKIKRPDDYTSKVHQDIDWVLHALKIINSNRMPLGLGYMPDAICILRPTSLFRTSTTIRRAFDVFKNLQYCDSIRAMQKCSQHPDKMWQFGSELVDNAKKDVMIPLSGHPDLHNRPYQQLRPVYIQNACIEIIWTDSLYKNGTTSGKLVKPFFTLGYEGYDINNINDWTIAELLQREGIAKCQTIK